MKIQQVTLEAKRGDIAQQPDITAIVNAANAELRIGGGVAGAIHRAAGQGLTQECRPLAPIRPGEAVITGAHQLPNEYVIHCLGPVYGVDRPEAKLLANCYRNALDIVEEHKIDSIAFPAISTGAFGYPLKDATEVVLSVLRERLTATQSLKRLRFVLFSDYDLQLYRKKLQELVKEMTE